MVGSRLKAPASIKRRQLSSSSCRQRQQENTKVAQETVKKAAFTEEACSYSLTFVLSLARSLSLSCLIVGAKTRPERLHRAPCEVKKAHQAEGKSARERG